MIKLAEFEKKGKFIEVMLELVNPERKDIYLVHEGKKLLVHSIGRHSKHGFFYEVNKDRAEEILNIKVNLKGGSLYITSPTGEQVKEKADKMFKEFREKELEKAFSRLTDDMEIRLSFGSSHTFVNTPVEYANRHPFIKNGVAMMSDVIDDEQIREVLGRDADEVDWGDYSITTKYNMTFAEFKKLCNYAQELHEKREAEKEARKKAKQEAIDEKFAEAKRTGKPVELYRYTASCNDPNEECNIDHVVEYAMPDGSVKTERYHTY